ncbi:hypothetical protein PSAB6_210070 [Paraburkholderia sabiae]|nr:hypothetical protein PSAB6_210070 [Paraburkholderia sabiae]
MRSYPRTKPAGKASRALGAHDATGAPTRRKENFQEILPENFPRRYYPDRVRRVSLSLAAATARARSTPVSSRPLDHKSRARRKPVQTAIGGG